MTDVATRDEQPTAVATRPAPLPVPAGAEENPLVVWAYAAHQAHQIATKLAATSFVPTSLRGKPGDITAAILAGQELGLQPMATLRSIDVIQGTPALRAHAMRAVVQAHGHETELVESSDTHCVMRGRRRTGTSLNGPVYGGWQQVTWTIERAQRLGLTGKDQWKKQPATMLIARATGEICRLIASDALHAMPYAAEELGDSDAPVSSPVVTRVTKAEVLGQAPAAELEREPVDDGWPEPAEIPGGAA
jgi:hypothetical protein